jgi:hypothetical protein
MKVLKRTLVAGVLLVAGFVAILLPTHEASARVGRGGIGRPGVGPGGVARRPVPVAGVARRTTRRMVRRSAIYVTALPYGCTTVVIDGATYYQCGAPYYTYYAASGTRYEVVYVDGGDAAAVTADIDDDDDDGDDD